jgi:hypothetical protein
VEIRNPLVIRGSSQRDYLLKPEGFKVGLFDAYLSKTIGSNEFCFIFNEVFTRFNFLIF